MHTPKPSTIGSIPPAHPVVTTGVGLPLKVELIPVAIQRGRRARKALKDHSETFPASQTAFQRIVTSMAGLDARNATLPSTLGFSPSYLSPLNPRASEIKTQQNTHFVTSLYAHQNRPIIALAAFPPLAVARTYYIDCWKWMDRCPRPSEPGLSWPGGQRGGPCSCLGRSLMTMPSHLPAAVHLVHDLRLR
jgi:hypothetical protein